jgi:predicted nucleic acid-binding protein
LSGFLLDTGVISRARVSGLSLESWIGSPDLAVSIVSVDEAFAGLPADDPKALGNARLLAAIREPLLASDEVEQLSIHLIEAYALHSPPLATNDAVIAATALLEERTLVTLNRRDFHYIEGLSWVDANGFSADVAPLLGTRSGVIAGPSEKACCRRLRAAPDGR